MDELTVTMNDPSPYLLPLSLSVSVSKGLLILCYTLIVKQGGVSFLFLCVCVCVCVLTKQ